MAFLLGPLSITEADTIDKNGVHHVNATEAAALITETPGLIILDVRTPAEFEDGHLEGAINIDYYADNFKDLLAELDPDTPYLLHCRTGARSGRTLPLMHEIGFTNIHHMQGGIESWKSARLPVSNK